MIFTWGQFWPLGIVVACICLYVCLNCVCVNPELVCVVAFDPFTISQFLKIFLVHIVTSLDNIRILLSHPGIPGVTLCFCTGSYAAAARAAGRRLCPRDNFWTTFWISFIFGTIVGPDL